MKKKTETLLCIAFMELLRKYPFPKITIQKIAQQCGVNRQTFYYYFDNIYDLMTKALEYELIRESHLYEETSWEAAMERFLVWMKDNRVIIKNVLTNVEIIRERDGEMDEFTRHFLVIGITQYILEWVENDYRESVDEVIRKLFYIIKKVYD